MHMILSCHCIIIIVKSIVIGLYSLLFIFTNHAQQTRNYKVPQIVLITPLPSVAVVMWLSFETNLHGVYKLHNVMLPSSGSGIEVYGS